MNGFQAKMLSVATVAGGMFVTGCQSGDGFKHGDPCWPDRYANEARELTVASFQPQVDNGHILDQTIWNLHFEYGGEKLNGAGMDKLDQLSRRRPTPDVHIFLQTSRDIVYDSEKPADYAAKRVDLDTKRVAGIQKYLKATLTGRELAFDIQIHDPAYPGVDVNPGVAPRIYIPHPGEISGQPRPGGRAAGLNVPLVPVTGINGAAAGGGGAAGGSPAGGSPAPATAPPPPQRP